MRACPQAEDTDNHPAPAGWLRVRPGADDSTGCGNICLAASASQEAVHGLLGSRRTREWAVSRSGQSTGGIAQLVERQLCKLDVTGSSPVASTNATGRVAQLVRARP